MLTACNSVQKFSEILREAEWPRPRIKGHPAWETTLVAILDHSRPRLGTLLFGPWNWINVLWCLVLMFCDIYGYLLFYGQDLRHATVFWDGHRVAPLLWTETWEAPDWSGARPGRCRTARLPSATPADRKILENQQFTPENDLYQKIHKNANLQLIKHGKFMKIRTWPSDSIDRWPFPCCFPIKKNSHVKIC